MPSKSKGRPKKELSKSKKDGINKPRRDSSCCSNRPPTRRNPKDMPKERTQSVARASKHASDNVTSDQHEYLQFSLRITEDIIKNDLYTNDQMKEVLNKHFEANKGKLDKKKMKEAMVNLCHELNISPSKVLMDIGPVTSKERDVRSKSKTQCICQNEKEDTKCECSTDRTPPISCKLHTQKSFTCNQFRSDGLCLFRKEVSDSNTAATTPNQNLQEKQNGSINQDDVEVIHQPKQGEPDDMNVHSEPIDSGKVDFLNSEHGDVKQHCLCESPSCNPSTCDEVSEKKAFDVSPSTTEPNLLLVPVLEDVVVTKFPEQSEESRHSGSDDEIEKFCPCANESCIKEKFNLYIEYYNRQMKHPKYTRELNASHYSTSIEPTKPLTVDLSVQTSSECIKSCRIPENIKSCVPTQTPSVKFQLPETNVKFTKSSYGTPCKETQYNLRDTCSTHMCLCNTQVQGQNDSNFLILNGPILVPKTHIRKSQDDLISCHDTFLQCCNCTEKSRSEQQSCCFSSRFTNTSAQSNFKGLYVTPRDQCITDYCNQSWLPKELSCKNYNDYDLTPQKDTLLDSSLCPCNTTKSNNLLLSNRYNRYTAITEHLSHFYPTIATQVSSMELLNYDQQYDQQISPQPSGFLQMNKKHESRPLTPKHPTLQLNRKTVSKESLLKTISDGQTSVVKTSLDSSLNEDEILKKLDSIPAVKSTESMHDRIEKLRSEVEKFREVDEEYTSPGKSLVDEQPIIRERGVSISEEVELIKTGFETNSIIDPVGGSKHLKRSSLLKYSKI